MFAWVIPLLNAIAAVPKIAEYVERFAAAVVEWWIGRQQEKTLKAIADAAAFSARATTKELRYEAAARWRDALSRPRITS